MRKTLFLIFLLAFKINGKAQVPSTKDAIQHFIDSIGRNNHRHVITSSIIPAFANGQNYQWRQNIWRNRKKELLWVEAIIPDSLSTVFFYYQDTLVFAGERTFVVDTVSHKRQSLFRNIFFYQSKIIEDSAPGRNNNTIDYYLEESKKFRELAKKAD